MRSTISPVRSSSSATTATRRQRKVRKGSLRLLKLDATQPGLIHSSAHNGVVGLYAHVWLRLRCGARCRQAALHNQRAYHTLSGSSDRFRSNARVHDEDRDRCFSRRNGIADTADFPDEYYNSQFRMGSLCPLEEALPEHDRAPTTSSVERSVGGLRPRSVFGMGRSRPDYDRNYSGPIRGTAGGLARSRVRDGQQGIPRRVAWGRCSALASRSTVAADSPVRRCHGDPSPSRTVRVSIAPRLPVRRTVSNFFIRKQPPCVLLPRGVRDGHEPTDHNYLLMTAELGEGADLGSTWVRSEPRRLRQNNRQSNRRNVRWPSNSSDRF